jgi:hypothetical protein
LELYFTCQTCGKIVIAESMPEHCSDCDQTCFVKGLEKLFVNMTYEEKQALAEAQREWNNIKTKKSYHLKGKNK